LLVWLIFIPWRWRQYIPAKHQQTPIRLHIPKDGIPYFGAC
jgi:hypothetical protein